MPGIDFNEFLHTYPSNEPGDESAGLLDEVEFPIQAFPKPYQELISGSCEILKTEASHLGTAILGAISLAIGNTVRVQAGNHNSPIPGSIWAILVEPSGGGKGRAQRFGYRPIEDYAEQRRIQISNEKTRIEKALYEARRDIYNTEDKDEKKGLETAKRQLERELEELEDYYLIINDITMEAVRTANLKNRRGIGIVRDEISGWYNSFGKYSKGGNASSEESFYIETYDGAPLLPFRAGSKGVTCDLPFTTVFGGTQPDTLGDLGRNNRMVSGFVFRILFSYPNEKPLARRSIDDYEVNSKINEYVSRYDQLIKKLFDNLELKFKDDGEMIPDPRTVRFNKEALKKYVTWFNREAADFANNLNVDQQTRRTIKSIVSRSDMSMLRICLLVEAMKWSIDESSFESITPETVKSAAQLMDYYRFTMLKVYSEVEKIRFEEGKSTRRARKINYHKVFNGRKELSRPEMMERISKLVGISELTAEKYMNEDEKKVKPPFSSYKDGRNKLYRLMVNEN